MKFLIRCDSSIKIGTGHVARCIQLASFLKLKGHEIYFACRELEGNIISLIEEKQFKVFRMAQSPTSNNLTLSCENSYPNWLGTSLACEISDFSEILNLTLPDWVISDHYSLPIEWESSVKKRKTKLLVIDDIARKHQCDALLDQNIQRLSEQQTFCLAPNAKLFLGPEYALISPLFLATLPRARNFKCVQKILVFFGGTDATGETLKLLKNQKLMSIPAKFDIIVGKSNPFLNEIKAEIPNLENATLHIQTNRMHELMNEADLFIGAGGTTTWERCFLGLPSVCVSVAENQTEIAKELARLELHLYLGESHLLDPIVFYNSVISLISNTERRRKFSDGSMSLHVASKVPSLLELLETI